MHPDGYFALLLTPESSAQLVAALATLPAPLAHHCTVAHGTRDPSDLPGIFATAAIGDRFGLRVRGFATRADGGIQAAVVALILADGREIERGFSSSAVPHVAVATDGLTEPAEANALLQAGFTPIDGPILAATLLHSDAWRPSTMGAQVPPNPGLLRRPPEA
jgi:hypothetical protein